MGWGGGFRLNVNICARYGFWYLGLLVLVCVALKYAGWLARRRYDSYVWLPRVVDFSSQQRCWLGAGISSEFQHPRVQYGCWYLGLLLLLRVAIKHAGWLARRFLLAVAVPRLILLSSLIVCCRRLMGISSELQNPRARCGRFQIGFYYAGLFCVDCALQLHCVFIGTIRTR